VRDENTVVQFYEEIQVEKELKGGSLIARLPITTECIFLQF
jgi:hypothetical protein